MLVEGYIKEAQAARKFDDVKLLKQSLDELAVETTRLQADLAAELQYLFGCYMSSFQLVYCSSSNFSSHIT